MAAPEKALCHCRVIEDEEGFRSLELQWDQLIGESEYDTIYLNYFWLHDAWLHFREQDPSARLYIFCFYEQPGDSLAAIVPLMKRTVSFKRIFKIDQAAFLCDSFCDESGFLIRKGFTEQIVDQFCAEILNRTDWQELLLNNLSENNPVLAALQSSFERAGVTWRMKDKSRNYYIITASQSFENYRASLSAGFRQNLKTAKNRLANSSNEKQVAWRFEDLVRLSGDDLQRFIELDLERQESKARTTMYRHAAYVNFVKKVVSNHPEYFPVTVLRFGTEIMAFSINIRYRDQLVYWSPSLNRSYLTYSPGQLLLENIVETCFREGWYVDLAAGDSEYKSRWTPTSHAIRNFRVYHPGRSMVHFLSKL